MTKSLPISGPSSAAFGQPHKPAIDRRTSTNKMITKPTSGESPPPSRSGGGAGGGGHKDGGGRRHPQRQRQLLPFRKPRHAHAQQSKPPARPYLRHEQAARGFE